MPVLTRGSKMLALGGMVSVAFEAGFLAVEDAALEVRVSSLDTGLAGLAFGEASFAEADNRLPGVALGELAAKWTELAFDGDRRSDRRDLVGTAPMGMFDGLDVKGATTVDDTDRGVMPVTLAAAAASVLKLGCEFIDASSTEEVELGA